MPLCHVSPLPSLPLTFSIPSTSLPNPFPIPSHSLPIPPHTCRITAPLVSSFLVAHVKNLSVSRSTRIVFAMPTNCGTFVRTTRDLTRRYANIISKGTGIPMRCNFYDRPCSKTQLWIKSAVMSAVSRLQHLDVNNNWRIVT